MFDVVEAFGDEKRAATNKDVKGGILMRKLIHFFESRPRKGRQKDSQNAAVSANEDVASGVSAKNFPNGGKNTGLNDVRRFRAFDGIVEIAVFPTQVGVRKHLLLFGGRVDALQDSPIHLVKPRFANKYRPFFHERSHRLRRTSQSRNIISDERMRTVASKKKSSLTAPRFVEVAIDPAALNDFRFVVIGFAVSNQKQPLVGRQCRIGIHRK